MSIWEKNESFNIHWPNMMLNLHGVWLLEAACPSCNWLNVVTLLHTHIHTLTQARPGPKEARCCLVPSPHLSPEPPPPPWLVAAGRFLRKQVQSSGRIALGLPLPLPLSLTPVLMTLKCLLLLAFFYPRPNFKVNVLITCYRRIMRVASSPLPRAIWFSKIFSDFSSRGLNHLIILYLKRPIRTFSSKN